MKPRVRYVVTVASRRGEFRVGDRIRLEADGAIVNLDAGGWMDKRDVAAAIEGMRCEIDLAWLDAQRERMAGLEAACAAKKAALDAMADNAALLGLDY